MFVWSYKGYTISKVGDLFYITYPKEKEASIFTYTLQKAYSFVDAMQED